MGGGEGGDGVTPPPKLNNMYISKVDLKILKLKKIFLENSYDSRYLA